MTTSERQFEEDLIEKLRGLKYEYRADIRDRAALEKNFREKFETLKLAALRTHKKSLMQQLFPSWEGMA